MAPASELLSSSFSTGVGRLLVRVDPQQVPPRQWFFICSVARTLGWQIRRLFE